MSNKPFCIDCAHYKLTHGVIHSCTRIEGKNLVTGEPMYYSCINERTELGTCGPDGYHFLLNPQRKLEFEVNDEPIPFQIGNNPNDSI